MPGNVEKRSKDTWRIRYELPRDPVTGKRRQGSETIRGTKKDAEKRLREILTDLDKGIFADAGDLTVGQYMQGFLAKYEADHPVAVTARNARWLLTDYVINEFGSLPPGSADAVPY